MRITGKKSVLAAAVMAVTLLGNGVVLADGGRHHESRQAYGHHGYYGNHKQYRTWHRKAYRYGDRHDRGYYDKGHYGRHVTNYYQYDDDDDDEAENLLIGIALGGLLGYAINQPDY